MKRVIGVLLGGFFLWSATSCSDQNGQSNESVSNDSTEVSVTPDVDYLALGKEIAQLSFKTLSGELKAQIVEGGPVHAIPFCNENAIPLTDSLATAYSAKIERVAVNYRNPKNKAVGYDTDVYMSYSAQLSDGKMVKPKLHTNDDGQTVFYAPIILKAQCVVCHGEPIEEVNEETLTKIAELYPDDLATGYSEGDLRGLWKITFNK